ncbi:MAG: hypothetical protein IKN51_05755, partial [Bacteroidaceae bacterium]|nr:hypothetical protein [Bacteroidaceae bacterium]
AYGIAASLSDFLCMLAPASPTANESLRDAYGIPHSSLLTVNHCPKKTTPRGCLFYVLLFNLLTF